MPENTNPNTNTPFAFWGTDNFACVVLETLKEKGVKPSIIITAEDKPQGRKLILTPPPVKLWAEKNNISILQPSKLDKEFVYALSVTHHDLFLVASYGKIIPKEIVEMPEHGTLNIHPSLLPKLRGSSPIQETILKGETPGVTIMKMDEKMDHGPIVAQQELTQQSTINNQQLLKASELEEGLAKLGAEIFAEILPDWVSGKIEAKPQDHNKATFTKKVEKSDGLIDLKDDPEKNYRKFLAYDKWPGVYFFQNNKRVKITGAKFSDGEFEIVKVIPEGKKEMNYGDFLRGLN